MQQIHATILVNILLGKYQNTESEYKYCYRKTSYSDEIEIVIENFNIVGEVRFNERTIINNLVRIENVKFNDKFLLLNVTFKKHLSIHRCIFIKSVNFRGENFNHISIHSCNYKQDLNFTGGNYNSVRIDNCISESVFISQGIFNTAFSIDGKGIKQLTIANPTTFINVLGIGHNVKNTIISVRNCKLNKIFLRGRYDSNSSVEFENIELHTIIFENLKNKGKILFRNIEINNNKIGVSNLKILDFYNKHNLSDEKKKEIQGYTGKKIDINSPLSRLHLPVNDELWKRKISDLFVFETDSTSNFFKIVKIEVGNMEFKNFPLINFEKIEVIDTDLKSLKTFNSLFPVKKVSGNNRSLYEIFNDLYIVAKNKNNKLEEVQYYGASQNSLYKFLLENWKKNIPSIVGLFISKIYSNYGSRWTQAFFLTTPILAFVFFSLMLLASNSDIDLSNEGLENFKNHIPYYLQFLNPTHKVNFLDFKLSNYEYSTNTLFVLFDFLGRIFVSIGIYETIKSFRKYAKT